VLPGEVSSVLQDSSSLPSSRTGGPSPFPSQLRVKRLSKGETCESLPMMMMMMMMMMMRGNRQCRCEMDVLVLTGRRWMCLEIRENPQSREEGRRSHPSTCGAADRPKKKKKKSSLARVLMNDQELPGGSAPRGLG